jgi:hypothetical protein
MNKQKITRFLQSFVAIPMLAIAAPLTGIQSIPSSVAIVSEQINTISTSVITKQEDIDRNKERAEKIDAFFALYDSPLVGYGEKFVAEANKNDIDWRLLPAIAMRESTGGKHACKNVPNSVFGYGSCKISFKSVDDSIRIVAESLGGNNPNTANHYDDKTTLQILRKYNSVIKNYPKQVTEIMKMINDSEEIA